MKKVEKPNKNKVQEKLFEHDQKKKKDAEVKAKRAQKSKTNKDKQVEKTMKNAQQKRKIIE